MEIGIVGLPNVGKSTIFNALTDGATFEAGLGLIFDGDGKMKWFQGNFAAYEEKVQAENPDRLAHRRSKYKRLKMS